MDGFVVDSEVGLQRKMKMNGSEIWGWHITPLFQRWGAQKQRHTCHATRKYKHRHDSKQQQLFFQASITIIYLHSNYYFHSLPFLIMAPKVPHIFLTGHPSVGKTTIIKGLQTSLQNDTDYNDLVTKGFYTEECRSKGGDRIGFDILYWTPTHQEPRRKALSRMVDRIKKSDPHVGKYLVEIDNVEQFAIASIDTSGTCTGTDSVKNELMIIDEVGKMEMLCPQFLPAVNNLLNENQNPKIKRIVIGTIPTPRYGRVIQGVEEIRGRDDVVVLHVTKANRDELKEVLQNTLKDIFSNKIQEHNVREVLAPFMYTRPIGASSMNGNGKVEPGSGAKNLQSGPCTSDHIATSKACGPLYMESVEPKVLLLGQTASPLPSNKAHSYCERSMWIVLGRMFQMTYKPIKDIETATDNEIETYLNLQRMVLSKGICIWDVFADLHEKTRGKNKRQKKSIENKPNDIDTFLKKHPSIKMVGFIGQKAHAKYKVSETASKVELFTLPSSSPANSRITVDEKVSAWKNAISKCIPDVQYE